MSVNGTDRITVKVEQTMKLIEDTDKASKIEIIIKNIGAYRPLTDEQRAMLINAASSKLRALDSSRATRILGPKGQEATSFVKRVYDRAAEAFDLSKNETKAGPKVGGLETREGFYLNRYISYRNSSGLNLGLSWNQQTPESATEIYVDLRQVTGSDRQELWKHVFDKEDDAAAEFLEKIAELAPSRS